MIKRYRTTTHLALPVYVDGKLNYAVFSEEDYGISVTDEKMQKAIEDTPYFKNGKIKLFEEIGEEEHPKAASQKYIEFPEVTQIQQAVDILKGEPFNIPHQSLRNPDHVKKHADANGVKFPNLKIIDG
ncbi:MAG: hypothetical protein LBE71_02225 [Dysgonamonadaceae bacterium]|jgi:hypothetical protein|nr:hypothetical protein [Dysgonamonadaceae bacterium]